jgi:hypothetical protein
LAIHSLKGRGVPEFLKDLLKQGISSLLSGALPVASGKLFTIAFLNPQIEADLWWVTALFAFAGSLFSYNLARTPPPQPPPRSAIIVTSVWFICGVLAVVAMIILNAGLVPVLGPVWASTSIRIAYVLTFIGIAYTVGFGAGRMLG